jgi:predicted RNA-binding Zn-ribbon protein involved in translation (DUF1610 family)
MKIKTSKISLEFANRSKRERLDSFILDYQIAVNYYIDFLWNHDVSFQFKDEIKTFSIKKDWLYLPAFLSNDLIEIDSPLSGRAQKCALTQAIGIIKSHIDKRRKLLYVLSILREKKKRTRHILKRLQKEILIKPDVSNVFPELNSICCKYEDSNFSSFDGFITLSSIGKQYGKIIIPINHTKHSRKQEKLGKLKTSFLITRNHVNFRYEIESPPLKETGRIVGVDQGITTCLTFSNGVTTQKCKHGHDLSSITKKISRKKKGSKSFHKAKDHQENYINWSINQLNLSDIKEIRLEKVSNFRHKKNVGKFLNHFNETLIRSKLKDVAENAGVLVIEQKSAYRSQRCSDCGYVCKLNRKGKLFKCKRCGYQTDADYNASCNHEQDLPEIDYNLQHSRNIKEFFWLSKGLFGLDGQALTVPDTQK